MIPSNKTTIVLLLTLISANLLAQEYNNEAENREQHRNEITIGAGPLALNPYYLVTWIIDVADAMGHNNYKAMNSMLYGNYSFNYHRQTLQWLKVGFKATYESRGNDYYEYIDKDKKIVSNIKHSHINVHWASLMGSVQFTYYNKGLFKLYSGADLGLLIYLTEEKYYTGDKAGTTQLRGQKTNNDKTIPVFLPAFDITPFGFTVGKQVYALAELN
ncbi:MAG: hypothetical protein IJ776_03715 [Paludibacteraceae bacterium]|nr:hypothetical protein [Paludibacteraceae bacterium]